MGTQKEVHRSFRLPADLDAKVVAKAEKLDRPVSWVILRCLEAELLGKHEALGKAVMRGVVKH
jgi:predicted transcriptional regulator